MSSFSSIMAVAIVPNAVRCSCRSYSIRASITGWRLPAMMLSSL